MLNFSILGGSELGKRPWKPGKKLTVITLLGGTSIDFQQAELEEAVTKVVCLTVLGGTQFIMPPGLPITLSGVSLLGGRSLEAAKSGADVPISGKSLAVTAIAVLGGVAIGLPKEAKPK